VDTLGMSQNDMVIVDIAHRLHNSTEEKR